MNLKLKKKLILITFLLSLSITQLYGQGYEAMMAKKPQGKIANMVNDCFNTICKHWIKECHWFCDNVLNKESHLRCLDCLGYRGRHCLPCFEM
uniref:Laminin EGF-like domain-containing protein n=1 Tax=Parastrongyloides trichosuri TaxID=131310 RepID=A0A0N5A547_PARTI